MPAALEKVKTIEDWKKLDAAVSSPANIHIFRLSGDDKARISFRDQLKAAKPKTGSGAR